MINPVSKKLLFLVLMAMLVSAPTAALAATSSIKLAVPPKAAPAKPKSNLKAVLNARFTNPPPKPGTVIKQATAAKPAAKKSTAPVATKKNLNIQQAYKIYRTTSYRLQFLNCHGSPGTLIMKKGAELMLDNRDIRARRIGIGSDQYIIPAYDFLIVTPRVTGVNYVTCDGGGAARLNVEM